MSLSSSNCINKTFEIFESTCKRPLPKVGLGVGGGGSEQARVPRRKKKSDRPEALTDQTPGVEYI